jgi:hypothetical protein
MLKQETNRCYFVYPSWGRFIYTWDDLPRLLSDPLHSGFLDPSFDYKAFRFSMVPRACEFHAGSFGGGIIAEHVDSSERWLGEMILGKEVGIHSPPGMVVLQKSFTTPVYFLNLQDPPGFVELGIGIAPQRFVCSMTPENSNAAGDSIFWVFGHEGGKKSSSAMDLLQSVGDLFDVSVIRISEPPDPVAIETAPWFVRQPIPRAWFQILPHGADTGDRAGYQLALLFYTALHLKMLSGKGLHWAHLVANIEGSPNARYKWGKPIKA